MRILSRMLAFAFDKGEPTSTAHAIECAECPLNIHSVLQAQEDEGVVYDWQHKHTTESGHSRYRKYTISVGESKVFMLPDSE